MSSEEFAQKRVTVMGLGLAGGGTGTARYFARQGAQVTVTDLRDESELAESVEALSEFDIAFCLGSHRKEDFAEADLVVASPAVPPDSEYVRLALSSGVPVECALTLFLHRCDADVVGVTGTLGKTTITSLLGKIMACTGRRTWVGGNIGRNPLDFVDEVCASDIVVLEVSSFQLEYMAPAGIVPGIAVVTGMSPDHMDRYRSFDEYETAKKHIVLNQTADDTVFMNADDEVVSKWAGDAASTVYTYGVKPGADVRIQGDSVLFKGEAVADLSVLNVPGLHNRANAAAAAGVASFLGAEAGQINRGLADFEGVDHRIQLVAEKNGIRFYDDSAATTARSTAAAIDAVEGPVSVIVGGYDKGLDMTLLVDACVSWAVRTVLIGASTGSLKQLFRDKDKEYASENIFCAADMQDAVSIAADSLIRGSVLLSPGYASFDMFRNYKERAEKFREAVYSLISSSS